MDESHIEAPKGVKTEVLPDGVQISWSTLGLEWAFLIIPAASFLLLLIGVISSSHLDVGQVCGVGGFGLIFLGLLYRILVSVLNKSVVEIGRGRLEARCGPIPYKSCQSFDLADIKQVYVVQAGGRQPVYQVCVLTKDGAHLNLWRSEWGFRNDGELALYLEQEIERFLGIPDEVVRGEWRPDPYLWENVKSSKETKEE